MSIGSSGEQIAVVLLGSDEVSVLLMSCKEPAVTGHTSLSVADSFEESSDSRAEARKPTGNNSNLDYTDPSTKTSISN